MKRLDQLKHELSQIQSTKCLAFAIKEQVVAWYLREIEVLEDEGE